MYSKFLQNRKMPLYFVFSILAFLASVNTFAQTPVPMASYTATPYVENFTDLPNWVLTTLTSTTTPAATLGTFSAGTGAAAWRGFLTNTTSNTAQPRQIPDANKIVQPATSTAVNNYGMKFQVITTGGLQRNESANATFPAGKLGIVATGTTDSTTSACADLFLNFTGVAAGTLSFTAEKVTNSVQATSATARMASMLVYGSIDGITWLAIPLGTSIAVDNTATVQTFTVNAVALPAIFNNSATARIRFYTLNGAPPPVPTAPAGNRPRIAIDDVSITALAGCSTPITFSSITPTSPSVICATNSLSLSATAAGATGISYLWTASTAPAVSGLVTTNASSVTVIPTATTIYTVTATSGSCVASTSFSVTVNALPSLSVSPTSATVCAGGTQSFTATSATATSFAWSPATELNTASGATVISTPTANRTYTIAAMDGNACVKTAIASIAYIANVNVTVSSTNLTLNCIGDETTLTASGANSYSWSNSSGLNSVVGATVIANPYVTTTYTVTGTAGACTGTTAVTVIANGNPRPSISFTYPFTVCLGSPVTITASGADTYSWSSTATLNTTTGATIISTPTTLTTYSVIGTSSAGCSERDSIDVNVSALPVIAATSTPIALCPGGSATLTATGGATYLWSNGDVTAISNIASVSSTTTYTVTGADAVGCTKTSTTKVSVASNGTFATYAFSTSIPFLGNYDNLLQCNSHVLYLSGIGFGNQFGTPTSQVNATSANTTAGASGGANAGVACKVQATNLATNSYFEFVVAPECAYGLMLNGLSFASRSTGTGPTTIQIATSADNFATAIATYSVGALNAWANNISPVFSPVSLSNSDSMKIRIYGSNGTGSGGSGAINWRIDDIKLNIGTIAVPATYPNITFSPPAPAVCGGIPAQVTASGASAFAWSASTTLTDTSLATVTASPTITTIYTVSAANGVCATSATISVFVPTASAPVTITVCSNALPYIWKGMPYVATGTYTNVSIIGGCLDTATLNLTVCQVSFNTASLTVCTLPYTWALYGHTFTAYGSDTVATGTNSCGCPTFTILTAIPGQPTVYDSSVNLCTNFVFPYLGGPNPPYSAFGTYTTSVVGVGGCSIITNFHILPKPLATKTITVVAAVPYTYLPTGAIITVNSDVLPAPPANIYTFTAANGCDSVVTLVVLTPAAISWPTIYVTVYLGGPAPASTAGVTPYSTFTGCPNCVMNDSLRVLGLIPSTEPYTALGYIPSGTGGGETIGANVLSVSGQNAIVDWVLVKVRKSTSGTNPNAFSTLKTVCALLQADGDVVSATDGISPVSFPNLPDGMYNVQVNHRNHLGVMSANELSLNSTTPVNFDFTATTSALYSKPAPNNNPLPLTGATRNVNGKRYLYPGTCDYTASLTQPYIKRKLINYGTNAAISDRIALLNYTNGTAASTNAYSLFDFNFNGKSTYNGANADRAILQQCVLMSSATLLHEQTPD
jgi:hypothetical protein